MSRECVAAYYRWFLAGISASELYEQVRSENAITYQLIALVYFSLQVKCAM